MADSSSLHAKIRPARMWWVLVLGVVCHLSFVLALGSMMWGMYHGMREGLGRLSGSGLWVGNLALLCQFPVLHSLMLTRRGQRLLGGWVSSSLGKALRPTTYALIASCQLLLVFWGWTPSGEVWWEASGSLHWWLSGAYLCSWLLLARAMWDAGLALQTGYLGWSKVWQGLDQKYPPLPTQGLYRFSRQPIYLSFAMTLWTVPIWTPDQLLMAVVWTGYCLLGPLHKEKRLQCHFGEAYRRYQREVPYGISWKCVWIRLIHFLRKFGYGTDTFLQSRPDLAQTRQPRPSSHVQRSLGRRLSWTVNPFTRSKATRQPVSSSQ